MIDGGAVVKAHMATQILLLYVCGMLRLIHWALWWEGLSVLVEEPGLLFWLKTVDTRTMGVWWESDMGGLIL